MPKRLLIIAAVLLTLLLLLALLTHLSGAKPIPSATTPAPAEPEHADLIYLPTASKNPAQEEMKKWHAVQSEMETAIKSARAGELDGDEWGMGECTIYCYGPDADRLWSVIQPILLKARPPTGTYAIKRYGPPGSPQKRLDPANPN